MNFVSSAHLEAFSALWHRGRFACFGEAAPMNVTPAEVQGVAANLRQATVVMPSAVRRSWSGQDTRAVASWPELRELACVFGCLAEGSPRHCGNSQWRVSGLPLSHFSVSSSQAAYERSALIGVEVYSIIVHSKSVGTVGLAATQAGTRAMALVAHGVGAAVAKELLPPRDGCARCTR